MKAIWKFEVPINADMMVLKMPVGAKVLTVQIQGHKPCLWAEIVRGAPTEDRMFAWFGTGEQFPDRLMTYIGTVQQECYVWHLYEL